MIFEHADVVVNESCIGQRGSRADTAERRKSTGDGEPISLWRTGTRIQSGTARSVASPVGLMLVAALEAVRAPAG